MKYLMNKSNIQEIRLYQFHFVIHYSTHSPSDKFDPKNFTINPTVMGPRIVFNTIAQMAMINADFDKIFVEKAMLAMRKPISPLDTMPQPTIRAG